MNHPARLLQLSLALVCATAGVSSARAASGEIVFDNTASPSVVGVFGPSAEQVGNEITLGGQARQISLVSWLVDSQNYSVWAGTETHIYANDGAGGGPGTLLWSSGPLTNYITPSDLFLNVPVPNVTVPDTITVTSRFFDATPVALGRDYGGSPTAGSLNASWAEYPPGVWTHSFGPWAMQVVAVPEPSSVSLMLTAGTLLAGLLRGRRNRGDSAAVGLGHLSLPSSRKPDPSHFSH
jgi:hypothetical protein